MAINTNTTKTLNKASTVLNERCEQTKANMAGLAKRIYGKATPKMETVTIPAYPGMKDDVVFAGLNGVNFYFLRGSTLEIPSAIAEILRNAGEIY